MHNRREDLTAYSPVRGKFVGYKLPRNLTLMFQCLAKEAFGGLTVSTLRYKDINNIPILIHRTPQVVALTSDLNEHFINVPDIPKPSLFPAQRSSIGRPKLDTPTSNCLVGDGNTPFSKKVFDITEAECESMVEPDGMADDFRRKPMSFICRFHQSIIAEISLT
jgi:hypothetical protein